MDIPPRRAAWSYFPSSLSYALDSLRSRPANPAPEYSNIFPWNAVRLENAYDPAGPRHKGQSPRMSAPFDDDVDKLSRQILDIAYCGSLSLTDFSMLSGHMDYTLRPHADASITSVSQPRSNILKSIVSDFLEVLHAREIPVSLVAHPNLASRFVSPANRFLCYLSHVATALSCVTGVPIRISFGQYSAGRKSEVQGVSSSAIISETFEQCIRDNSSGADKGLRSLNSFRDAHSRKQVRGCICT